MSLWAIEVTPMNGRGKPWINVSSVAYRRTDAWKKFCQDATPAWLKEIKRRRRRGLLRAVKVTIQLAEGQKQ